jgi:hypothetical protein
MGGFTYTTGGCSKVELTGPIDIPSLVLGDVASGIVE